MERKEKKTKEKERRASMESPRTARTQKEIQERATTATALEAENSREVVPTVANGGTRNQNAATESVTRKEKEEAPMRWTKKKTRAPMQCSTKAWTTKKTGIQKKSGNPEGKQANGRFQYQNPDHESGGASSSSRPAEVVSVSWRGLPKAETSGKKWVAKKRWAEIQEEEEAEVKDEAKEGEIEEEADYGGDDDDEDKESWVSAITREVSSVDAVRFR